MKTIDWYYKRNGWKSCAKAQEFLERNEIEPTEVVNCRKEPIEAEGLRDRLLDLDRVLVSRGKKLLELDPESDREEILKSAIGRSGKLRAPALRQGDLLIVGFHEEAYSRL